MTRATSLMLLAFVALPAAHAQPTSTVDRGLAVLVDTSMEFLFVYDHLADFLRRDGYTVTQNRGTLRAELLDDYDLVLIQQLTTPLPFDPQFISALHDWVQAGGRLWIVGHGRQWRNSNRDSQAGFPLNDLAGRFGLRFLESESGEFPLRGAMHPIAAGVTSLSEDKYDPRARVWGPGWLRAHGVGLIESGVAQPVIVDAGGKLVMATRELGRGRVVVFTGKRLLWGCLPESSIQYDADDIALIRRTLTWLLEGRPPRAGLQRLATLRQPDVELRGKRTSIRTTETLRTHAQRTLDQFDRVYDTLYGYFQVPAFSDLRINALAGSGGGWRGGDEIGIAVLADDDGLKSLLLWEMTNGWGPPIPTSWVETWAFHTAHAVAGRLRIGSPAGRILTRQKDVQSLLAADPALDKLDLADPGDEKTHRQVMLKASVVIEQLERQYPDFVPRLCRIHRAREGWTESLPMTEFVELCSLAAGVDLYPYFQSFGTTVKPRALDLSQAATLLEAYERRHPNEPKLPPR